MSWIACRLNPFTTSLGLTLILNGVRFSGQCLRQLSLDGLHWDSSSKEHSGDDQRICRAVVRDLLDACIGAAENFERPCKALSVEPFLVLVDSPNKRTIYNAQTLQDMPQSESRGPSARLIDRNACAKGSARHVRTDIEGYQ